MSVAAYAAFRAVTPSGVTTKHRYNVAISHKYALVTCHRRVTIPLMGCDSGRGEGIAVATIGIPFGDK